MLGTTRATKIIRERVLQVGALNDQCRKEANLARNRVEVSALERTI